jgi:ABC-type proline/glycine betaine transport system substrate-binding protein
MEIRYEKQEFNPGWDDRLAVAEQVKQLLIKNYGCTPEEVEVIGDMEWNSN